MARVIEVVETTVHGSATRPTQLSAPEAGDTVVGLSSVQTLTNKTLTSPTITAPVVSASAPVSAGGASLTLTAAAHGGKTMLFDVATGVAFTLPAATGSGVKFRFVVSVTVTSNQHRISVVGNDAMVGVAIMAQDGGNTLLAFEAAADTDRINMNGTTTGGVAGDIIELEDIATDLWSVNYQGAGTSTEATPFVTGAVS